MPGPGSSRKAPMAPPSAKAQSFKILHSIVKSALEADKPKKTTHKNLPAKRALRATRTGQWGLVGVSEKDKDKDSASASSLYKHTDGTISQSFDCGHPIADKVPALKCNHCRRAVLRHRIKAHVDECIAKKQEKQRRKKEAKDARDAAARKAERGGISSESSEDEVLTGSKTAATKTDGQRDGTAGKKRKAEDTAADANNNGPSKKKKKKDEIKAKPPRPKLPVDIEKQCGVELPQGGQCARSLTCKSHSMGAKRAVSGRSAPYDKLLADYQRKNQAKLQKAALENQQALLPEDELSPTGPIDSDEEKDLVLAAIYRSRPQPLYQSRPFSLKRKYEYVRLNEMMGGAIHRPMSRLLEASRVA